MTTTKPLPDKEVKCHHTGFKVSCFDGVTKHGCQKWTQVLGKNPQSHEELNRYGCADSFLPLIMIENTQVLRMTTVEVNKLRNEVAGYPSTAASLQLPPALLPRPGNGHDHD
jgi:hypothetical protein